jgi:UDP-N-acetylmuramoylalanine--D-glutamate ligase
MKICDGFDDAVQEAIQEASSGEVVLLSPASASFDSFKNYKERGYRFKEIVSSLV